MRVSKKNIINKVLLITTLIAFLINSLYHQVYGIRPQEYMAIVVKDNGDVGITIYCIVPAKAYPSELIDINFLSASIRRNEIGFEYLLPDGVSIEDIKVKINKWIKFFEKYIEIRNIKLLSEKIIKRTHPITRKMVNSYCADFKVDLKFDDLVEFFFYLKPDDGFLRMVNRKILERANITSIKISYWGTYWLDEWNIFHGKDEVYVELGITLKFENYFDYEYGRIYVLDVNELLNFSEPIRTYSRSSGTIIEILLELLPGFSDFEFIEVIKPKELRLGRRKMNGQVIGYDLSNLFPWSAFPGGYLIDKIRIKYKVVQAGLVIKLSEAQIYGLVLSVSVIAALCVFVFLALRKGRIKL